MRRPPVGPPPRPQYFFIFSRPTLACTSGPPGKISTDIYSKRRGGQSIGTRPPRNSPSAPSVLGPSANFGARPQHHGGPPVAVPTPWSSRTTHVHHSWLDRSSLALALTTRMITRQPLAHFPARARKRLTSAHRLDSCEIITRPTREFAAPQTASRLALGLAVALCGLAAKRWCAVVRAGQNESANCGLGREMANSGAVTGKCSFCPSAQSPTSPTDAIMVARRCKNPSGHPTLTPTAFLRGGANNPRAHRGQFGAEFGGTSSTRAKYEYHPGPEVGVYSLQ